MMMMILKTMMSTAMMILKTMMMAAMMMSKLEMRVVIGDISLACLAFCNHRENPLQKESIRAGIHIDVIFLQQESTEGKSIRMRFLYTKNPLEK